MKYTNELTKFLSDYEQYEQQILKPTYDEIKKNCNLWENTEYFTVVSGMERSPETTVQSH